MTQSTPRLRFEALGAKVEDLRLRTAVTWAGIALLGVPLLFTCPFFWAFVTYSYLKGEARQNTPGKTLAGAATTLVEIHDDHVVLYGESHQTLRPDDIVDGWLEADEHGSSFVVCRLRRGRRLVMHTREPAEAEEILATLGVDVSQAVARFDVESLAVEQGQGPVFHLLGAALLAMWAFPSVLAIAGVAQKGWSVTAPLIMLGILAVVALLFARMVRPGRVVVGMDGFRIRRGLRERFISYETVRGVDYQVDHVRVWVDDDILDLSCATFASREHERTHSLAQRLARAHEIFRARRGDAAAKLSLLERGERSVEAWRRDLEALARETGGYRQMRIDDAVLTEVVEDATAPAEQRLGAAIVLAARQAPPEVTERVRIASRSCANPRLRVALDHVLEGEALAEAELEAAIEMEARVSS
ncbi:MAG: hypothetical protein RIF41_25225 [Polyangiaceae bacterium]